MAAGHVQGARTRLGKSIPLDAWVLALGLLTWSSAVLLPCLHRGNVLSLGLGLLLGLGPLCLGAGLFLSRRESRFAPYALLACFPLALALPMSRLDHDLSLATFSPGNLFFSLLSFGGFLAAASAQCARPRALRPVEHKPLGEIPPIDLETRKQRIGQLTLGVVFAAGLAIVAFGAWDTPAHFRETWGPAAAEGATLTSLAAGIVCALALSIVGPGLRAARGKPPVTPEQRTRKALWLFLVALSGLSAYWMLRAR